MMDDATLQTFFSMGHIQFFQAFAIGAFRLKKWKLTRNFLTSPTQKMIQLIFGLVLGQICTGIHKLFPR